MSLGIISCKATISSQANIGAGTRIGDFAEIAPRARIGAECNIHAHVYVDSDVSIGDRCKLQRNVSIFAGAVIEDGVFVGPSTVVLNDRLPRAINPDGSLKTRSDWIAHGVTIGYGASVGGGATICPGVTIGRWALIGAGSVVTRDVPEYGLAVGNPARVIGFVDAAGVRLPGPSI